MPTNGLVYDAEGVKTFIPNRSYKDTHGVSMCCIILNEEKEIQDFLQYHKPYFKEIVMIDLGSVDKSVEIATPLVDCILRYKQDGHHSNALNRAIEKVSNNWTFLIDCDERVEKGILDRLPSLINQQEYDCYAFPRKNTIDGNPDKIHPVDFQDRLFRTYCRMVRPVHQEVVGYKKKYTLPEIDGNYIIHSKSLGRHKARNSGYILYEYKFKNEIGSPGDQTEETFNNKYPALNWEYISKMYLGK